MKVAALARDRMIAWLSQVAIDHAGAMPSWINPARPGYAYPEAAGLVTTVLAEVRPDDRALPSLTAWLLGEVARGRLVGRAGRGYVFDTAIVLTGLLAARRVGQAVDLPTLEPAFTALARAIESREATDDPDASARWSTRWSCHQLKLAWTLSHYDDQVVGDARAAALLDHPALAELLALELEGRFRVSTTEPRTYVHAACYALEGLIGLRRRGLVHPALERGAAWLASIQAEDGSLPNWVGHEDDDEQAIERPSDVIAQAIRIWLQVDRARHADAITRAIAQLLVRQHESGGLRYLPESDDINVWSTAFAVQALSWNASMPSDPWIA